MKEYMRIKKSSHTIPSVRYKQPPSSFIDSREPAGHSTDLMECIRNYSPAGSHAHAWNSHPIQRHIKIRDARKKNSTFVTIDSIESLQCIFPGKTNEQITTYLFGGHSETNEGLFKQALPLLNDQHTINKKNIGEVRQKLKEPLFAKMTGLSDFKAQEGGVDDGAAVGDVYVKELACSLFALLAVRPGFMGADSPKALHGVLRKHAETQEYDDDGVCGKIRLAAGLTNNVIGGTVNNLIKNLKKWKTAKKQIKEVKDAYIIDPAGAAHTFAIKPNGDQWLRYDNQVTGGDMGNYGNSPIRLLWE